jgi:hypothetical protein
LSRLAVLQGLSPRISTRRRCTQAAGFRHGVPGDG